jgi:hypothetical protein
MGSRYENPTKPPVMNSERKIRKNGRTAPDIAFFVWMLIVGEDLPGLLMTTADNAGAVLDVTLDREIFSTAVLDAEEAFTSVFKSPLRTR